LNTFIVLFLLLILCKVSQMLLQTNWKIRFSHWFCICFYSGFNCKQGISCWAPVTFDCCRSQSRHQK
jgi:hypothetical protein